MTSREHHNIEMLAYYLWLSRGCPEWQSDEIWHEAETKFFEYIAETPITEGTSLFGIAAIEGKIRNP
jgi:hypothetical protein